MKTEYRIFHNIYLDSVALMRISAELTKREGIVEASVLMGTPSNMDLLIQSGLLQEAPVAKPSDLVVTIKGDESILDTAFDEAVKALQPKESKGDESSALPPPTSLRCAVAENADASFALISVPGTFAAAEALKAIGAGLNVMIFSDNVPVWQEVALKRAATERGLLVMGPDCGTAIINGVPLAFANAVRRGSIGIVGASGTGVQQVSCLIHSLGEGISQAIGTGGHDLSAEVGGLTMLAGIAALAGDNATKVITLISKPPSREVGIKILKAAAAAGKPVVVNFFGADTAALIAELDESERSRFCIAGTLEEAAHRSVALATGKAPTFTSAIPGTSSPAAEALREQAKAIRSQASLTPQQTGLRALYTGGTFCYETQCLLGSCLGDIYSNAPAGSSKPLENPFKCVGNTIADLGDDVFTRGRPHPMIDPSLRAERVITEGDDPETAVIFTDCVIGYGSHPDPAEDLSEAIRKAKANAQQAGRHITAVVSVCGTEGDPQGLTATREKLRAAGALVFPSNAQATRFVQLLLGNLA